MILGIGTDVAAVSRFREKSDKFLDRILSPLDKERLKDFVDPAPNIAGIWAAKEALVKALDNKTLDFSAITVLHTGSGKPYFSFTPETGRLHLTISHEKDYAAAFVIWESN